MTEFTIKASFVKVMSALKDGERGRLWTAMCNYALTGEDAELTGNERVLYPAAKLMIDACNSSDTSAQKSDTFDEKVSHSQKTHTTHREIYKYSTNFERFWNEYPKERRIDKQRTYAAWCKYEPDDTLTDSIIQSLRVWKECEQWKDPYYIPHSATFLNNKRWEQTPTNPKPKNPALQYKQTPINADDFDAMLVNLDEMRLE